MKSKHFMHWFFGGEKMSKLTEVNLVENIIKKKTPSWIAPNYECEWKGPLGTKKQWIQWIQRDDICYTRVQSIVPTDSFEVSSTFAATCFPFIHSFICAFSDFPINCKGFFFFVFHSISNTVNVNKPLSIFCILHGISAPDQQFGKRKMMLMEK